MAFVRETRFYHLLYIQCLFFYSFFSFYFTFNIFSRAQSKCRCIGISFSLDFCIFLFLQLYLCSGGTGSQCFHLTFTQIEECFFMHFLFSVPILAGWQLYCKKIFAATKHSCIDYTPEVANIKLIAGIGIVGLENWKQSVQ